MSSAESFDHVNGYRSRSPYVRRYSRSRSRSRSRHYRSPSIDGRGYRRSPGYGYRTYTKRRYNGPRENARPSKCLGRSRGFGFVYFAHLSDAKKAKEEIHGIELDGRSVRVDFSITDRAHSPTPGIYMGKPGRGTRRRSFSPRRYSRSRSRSRSYNRK